MEQLLPISKNFTDNKLSNGSFNFFEKLKLISKSKNVILEAAIPNITLQMDWEEYATPEFKKDAFSPILSPRLLSYKFQYFAIFSQGDCKLECPDSNNTHHCEFYEVRMKEKILLQSNTNHQGRVNCSWLFDFLINASAIANDTLRNEKLIWNQNSELILESETFDKKVREREVICFQNEFKSICWKHYIILK